MKNLKRSAFTGFLIIMTSSTTLLFNNAYAERFSFAEIETPQHYIKPSRTTTTPSYNNNRSRFELDMDDDAGIIVIDKVQNLEFTLCPVGMTSSQNSPSCSGKPYSLTYRQALSFSRKAGNGWRLPTYSEFSSFANSSSAFKSESSRLGENFQNLFFWTSAGVSGRSGSHWVLNTFERNKSTPFKADGKTLKNEYKFPVFFARKPNEAY